MKKEFRKNLHKGRIYLRDGVWSVRYETKERVKSGSTKQLGSYRTVTQVNYVPIRKEDTRNLRDPYDQGKETCFELFIKNEPRDEFREVRFIADTKPVWYAKLWSTSEMAQDLQHYFEITPQEQIDEDWEKSKIFDNVGPTVSEFLGEPELTPEEKAGELFYYFYNRIEHKLSDQYNLHSTEICKMCALKVVEEVLDVAYYNNNQPEISFYNKVKKHLEKIGS